MSYEIPVKIGMVLKSEKSPVTEIGEPLIFEPVFKSPVPGDDYGIAIFAMVPVRLDDDSYRLVYCLDELVEWVSVDEVLVKESYTRSVFDEKFEPAVIRNSVEMPEVKHGIGAGVVHVRGRDKIGKFLLKIYYGDKRFHQGYVNAIYRD